MTVTFKSYAVADGSGSTTLSIFPPAGMAKGDILIAMIVASGNGTNISVNQAGWTKVASQAMSGPGYIGILYTYTVGIVANEPSAYQFTYLASKPFFNGGIFCYTGNTPVIDVISSSLTVSTSSPNTCPSITTTKPGSLVYVTYSYQQGNTPGITPPTGFTEQYDGFPSSPVATIELAIADMPNYSVGATGALQSTSSGAFAELATALIQIYDTSPSSGLFFGATI